MSESSLSIDYNTLRREVGGFLGWGRDYSAWTPTQNTDFADVLARGLRTFYFPPTDEEKPYYEWSFLQKTGTITFNTAASYKLPDDFGGTILDDSVTYAAGKGARTLQYVPEAKLRKIQAMDQAGGLPKYFAVRNETHDPTAGQRWDFLTYPTPRPADNGTAITYRYVYVPDTLDATNTYPVGGAQYSETVLAAIMAAAETMLDNDPAGPYMQRFQLMLKQAMRNDQNQKTRKTK